MRIQAMNSKINSDVIKLHQVPQTSRIRNFCVIAHIDHGKSTLCDRFLEITGTVEKRNMQEQILDSNPIERERGITIKLAPVRMIYRQTKLSDNSEDSESQSIRESEFQKRNSDISDSPNHRFSDLSELSEFSEKEYVLNLIDTPGHVDFSYEVSRSLAACEGAILVVDATQGVQAQTIGNTLKAIEQRLVVIPVINKIDLPNADIDGTKKELMDIFGFGDEEIISISAKTGENCEKVLLEVIKKIPPPTGTIDPRSPMVLGDRLRGDENQMRALIFNSFYDSFKGVVAEVKVVDGEINFNKYHEKNKLKFLATATEFTPTEVGYFSPGLTKSGMMKTGEVGYVATGLKNLELCRIGDTIADNFNVQPLPGYSPPKPFVFAGIFPIDNNDFINLKKSLEKLKLTDSSLTIKPISTAALGNGFYAGFLGLLHLEIVRERLAREFGMEVVATNPNVEYEVFLTNGEKRMIDNPTDFPKEEHIFEIREPFVRLQIFTPKDYVGGLMKLSEEKRGRRENIEYFEKTVKLTYVMPFAEMVSDFYDRLKSVSSGFASLSYEIIGFERADVLKIDILLNGKRVDALSFMVEKSKTATTAKRVVEKFRKVIPRQQFNVAIQAVNGAKILAREDVKPFRKDVIQKLYGGDRTRKDKLLEAQKKGKKRMKMLGNVEIPQSAFFEIFKM